MKKKWILLATSISIFLVIGSVVATLVLTPVLTASGSGNVGADASSGSGAIVIAWNKELLHIVKTPGAQPATVHPTRSFAILHAAIYDAVVSITRDAPPYLFSVPAPSSARPDAAAAEAGHDILVVLYPKWKAALDQQLVGELATIPDGAGKQQGIQAGQAVAARLITIRANDGSAATPPPWNLWNEIAENAALAHHTNLVSTARLFAVLNLSFADSVIAFYDAKYHYQLWRPITAIRLAKTVGNPAVVGDPNWTPLVVTALDPAYPAAHAVISADAATVLAAFFGNKDQIRATSDVLPGVAATYTSYSDIATEAGLSRIYAGNHTRIETEVGLTLGNNVAQFVISDLGA